MLTRLAIHSAPRSGSTWLGEMLNSVESLKYCYQPLFSYALKDYLTSKSSAKDLDRFYEQLVLNDDDFIGQKQNRQLGFLPTFRKIQEYSHVCYKEVRYHHLLDHLCQLERKIRWIFIIRNPVDVMNSWISSPREFHPQSNIDDELYSGSMKNAGRIENFYGLSQWISLTNVFHQLSSKYPDSVYIINYDELKNEPFLQAKKLFEFCNLKVGEQTIDFIRDSTSSTVEGTYSVFRDKAHEPEMQLNEKQVSLIKDLVSKAGLSAYLR